MFTCKEAFPIFIVVYGNVRTLLNLELRRQLFQTMKSKRFGHVVEAVEYIVMSFDWATAPLTRHGVVSFDIYWLTTLVNTTIQRLQAWNGFTETQTNSSDNVGIAESEMMQTRYCIQPSPRIWTTITLYSGLNY